MRWLKKHKNGVNGAICIAVALALLVSLVIYAGRGIYDNEVVSFVAIFIALYACTRGVFTMVFDFKESDMGVSVYRHVRIELLNQLFFVYEHMIWVWGLLPIIEIGCLLFVRNEELPMWSAIVLGSVSITSIAVFSKPLIRKSHCLHKRLKEIENDLVKTNASS